ncbi:MAG: hypothetical protein QM495_12295 [Lutibacter sp.]|uniref:hypothetical protein n=1 Tax=Lutibacter sp. TaxID=1925666 RepID=UPI00385CC00A
MKANALNNEPYLKLIKNNHKRKVATTKIERIYINTLMPGFSYLNKAGKNIFPHNCALL